MMKETLQILVGNRNERAFAKLFNSHADAIYRFIFWRVGDEELAQDMTSDVFTKAWEKWETFDSAYPKAWLYTIARNKVIDSYRKRSDERIDDNEEQVSDHSVEDALDSQMSIERVKESLDRLDERNRMVIELRFMSGMTAREAAHIMETTEANVRVLQYRALKELRRYI